MKKLLYSIPLSAVFTFTLTSLALAQDITVNKPSTVSVTNIGNVISAAVGLLIIVAAVLAFLYLILGGLQWITSGGDKTALESARNKITNAIIGLIIVAAAWAVMFLVGQFIGFNILGGSFNIPTINNPQR